MPAARVERVMSRSLLAAMLLACAVAAAAAPAPKKNGAASEQELREVRGRIEKLQAELAAAERSSGEVPILTSSINS